MLQLLRETQQELPQHQANIYKVTIVGSIGSGKSSLLKSTKKQYEKERENLPYVMVFCEEDISDWENDYGANWPVLFYENTERWAIPFQLKVLQGQIRMIQKAIEEINNSNCDKPVILVTERSPLDGVEIFLSMLRDDGIVTEQEYQLFYWFTNLTWIPSAIVYVDTSLHECLERVKARRTEADKKISVEYLTTLWNKYKQVTKSWQDRGIPIYRYDNDAMVIESETGERELNRIDDVLNYCLLLQST
jgi:deoxyadenosine/deoxycytidine kinase